MLYTARIYDLENPMRPIAELSSSDTGLRLFSLADFRTCVAVDVHEPDQLETIQSDGMVYATLGSMRLCQQTGDNIWALLDSFPPEVENAMSLAYPAPF